MECSLPTSRIAGAVPRRALSAQAVGFGLGYFLCGLLANWLSYPSHSVASLWLPSGLYAGVLLRQSTRHWLVFALAALAGNLACDLALSQRLVPSVGFWGVNTLEAFMGAWLVRRFVADHPRLATWREVLGVVGYCAVLSPLLGGALEAGVAAWGRNEPFSLSLWIAIWSGGMAGVLVMTPVVLTWAAPASWIRLVSASRRREWVLIVLAVLAISWLVMHAEQVTGVGWKYLVLPLAGVAALRFGSCGVAAAMAAMTLGFALHNRFDWDLPLTRPSEPDLRIIAMQVFVAVASLAGLLLAAFGSQLAVRERQWRESEARYRSLFEHSLDGVALHEIIADPCGAPVNYTFLDVNPAFERHTGIKGADCLGRRITEAIPALRQPPFLECYGAVALAGKTAQFEHHVPELGRHFEIAAFSPAPGQFATVFRDITERKAQEAEIQRLSQLYLALSQINQLITRVKTREELLDGLCRLLVTHGKLELAWVAWSEPESLALRPAARFGDDESWPPSGSPLMRVSEAPPPSGAALHDGKTVICNQAAQDYPQIPARFGSAAAFVILEPGQPPGVLSVYAAEPGFFRDKEINLLEEAVGDVAFALGHIRQEERRGRAEEELRRALEQQTALLKEVHHRVKNNLQLITSLLNLQARRVKAPGARAALQDTQERIRTMALLHETLYRAGNMDRVECGRYIEHLCAHLELAFGLAARRIQLQRWVRPPSFRLAIDQAVSCGLILNELVSNACKHAFPQDQGGVITVELLEETADQACLVVADNGAGLPESIEIGQSETLGLDLVSGLARQLGGDLSVDRRRGTSFEIRFKHRTPQKEP